jgi:hypothetical protein
MSLVWMGHTLPDLRELRGTVIGSERSRASAGDDHEELIARILGPDASKRASGVLRRYVFDLASVMSETVRVLRSRGTATFVVADATLFGTPVAVSEIVDDLARDAGLELTERLERKLPADRRYLPPPVGKDTGGLSRRMRHEVLLGYVAA